MSDPRSTYPKATAWTFLLETPAEAGDAPATKASAVGGNGRRAAAGAATTTKAAAKRRPSADSGSAGSSKSRSATTGEMGGACSKPSNDTVANKENMAELEEMLVPNGADPSTTSDGHGGDAECGVLGPAGAAKEGLGNDNAAVLGGAVLDSTAFLSPEPEQEADNDDEDSAVVAVENGIAGLRARGGHAGSGGDGRMRYEDKSAWVARSLGMLPRGAAVEVDQLKQLPGLEDCLLELLEERARHLTAMDNLTGQLRRREVEAAKASNDIKALSARLECSEQDGSALERRARAAGEEQRVERARWFVHKQELETRCVQLESKDAQYRATIRKKEVEYGRLQDSLRRTVDKGSSMTTVARGAGGKGSSAKGRGIETNLELSPGESTTEGGRHPLGGVLNEQAMCKAEELEAENAGLRSMLVDLQGEVMDLKGYHDRHGDLVSAERGSIDGGIWGGRMSVEPLPDDVIDGMPGDWLERQLGEETARQIKGMRGALKRVLGDGEEKGAPGDDSMSQEDLSSLMAQLREARSLLREQDAIMFAAIFDRPGADDANRRRCLCGVDVDGLGGSGVWDSLERLEQEREELERERSKLEKDKAKFLEEAVRRDSKSFVYSIPPATPTPATPAPRDSRYATPTHSNGQHQLGGAGKLCVTTASPAAGQGARGPGDASGMPLMTFTPPGASPDTAKLLGQLGISL